jgi:hypothetical protein
MKRPNMVTTLLIVSPIILIAVFIIILVLFGELTEIPEPIVIKNGCSYDEIYHSRRTIKYEYIHRRDCTNITHVAH